MERLTKIGAGSETWPFYTFIPTEKPEFFDTAKLGELFDHTGFGIPQWNPKEGGLHTYHAHMQLMA